MKKALRHFLTALIGGTSLMGLPSLAHADTGTEDQKTTSEVTQTLNPETCTQYETTVTTWLEKERIVDPETGEKIKRRKGDTHTQTVVLGQDEQCESAKLQSIRGEFNEKRERAQMEMSLEIAVKTFASAPLERQTILSAVILGGINHENTDLKNLTNQLIQDHNLDMASVHFANQVQKTDCGIIATSAGQNVMKCGIDKTRFEITKTSIGQPVLKMKS